MTYCQKKVSSGNVDLGGPPIIIKLPTNTHGKMQYIILLIHISDTKNHQI